MKKFLISSWCPNFDNSDFNPAELTLEDKEVWDKIQNGSIDAQTFAEYRQEVESEEGGKKVEYKILDHDKILAKVE